MASEVKLFRPWAAYSYDLTQTENPENVVYQTELSRDPARKKSSSKSGHFEKKRAKITDSKPPIASASSTINDKPKTWCSRKRELCEKKLSEKKLSVKTVKDSNCDVTSSSPSSNHADSTSSETSRKCDSSFSDFFHADSQSLDPLSIKSPLDLGFNYFNYPNYYDPSVIPYGLSPEEFFSVQGDFFYPNSADPWSDLAKFYSQTNQTKVKQRPKKFQCPHCNVAFSNNGQLKGHVRIHTGERPFKCDVDGCGKSFTRNEELTRHKRIHSGLRPFGCPHCGKKFGRKDHLKKHARTHLPQPRFAPQLVPLYPFLYGY